MVEVQDAALPVDPTGYRRTRSVHETAEYVATP